MVRLRGRYSGAGRCLTFCITWYNTHSLGGWKMTEWSYKEWYAKNRQAISIRRREKRAARTAEEVQRTRDYQKSYRENNRRPSTSGAISTAIIGGVEVRVFRIGEVAQATGAGQATLRLWERQGLIPRPTVKSSHRYYTEHQLGLLSAFYASAIQAKYSAARPKLIKALSKELFNQWKG